MARRSAKFMAAARRNIHRAHILNIGRRKVSSPYARIRKITERRLASRMSGWSRRG